MTEEDKILLIENKALMGPTLRANRPLLEQMKRVPLCAVCPAAQWYRIETDAAVPSLECFCTEFRGVMYEPPRRIVTVCDGRTDSVQRSLAKQEE